MRWTDPVARLRDHLVHDTCDWRALSAAAVLVALQRETGARWLFAPEDGGDRLAVRNVCAAYYRGDGLRMRIVVHDERETDIPVPSAREEIHVCRYGERPTAEAAAAAGITEWRVVRDGEALMVTRASRAESA